ncbi:MAG: transglycosylase SLT domain-containing protein [Bacteroidaceae bacterium]|nr:transglycosylase SLT domain-containing protein [Bacteroidaceae bacterium]
MKYTLNILLLILASMSWTLNAKGMLTQMDTQQVVITDDEEEDDEDEDDDDLPKSADPVLVDNDLPEGMTDREIDSLLNDWTVKNYLDQEEACDPSSVNPEFPKEVYIDRLSRLQTRIEMPYNEIVRSYIDRYTNRLRRSVSLMLGASNFYTPIFEEALDSYQLPLELKYLPVIESALNPGATSRVGAAGLWQFMIGTAKKYNLEVTSLIDERRDPVKASYAAAHFLKDLYSIFGDWTLCIAAYNCGPGNVNKAIKRAGGEKDFWTIYPYLPRETRGYVPAFIAATYVMNYYCDHNICPVNTRLPLAADTVMITRDLHLEQVAKVTGVELDELKALNPQYRTLLIPGNSHECPLKMSTDAVNAFLEAGDSVYSFRENELLTKRREIVLTDNAETVAQSNDQSASKSKKDKKSSKKDKKSTKKEKSKGGKSVTVKSGDTLSAIARRNGTTVEKLKKANGIKGDMIKPGQSLKVK